MSATSLDAHARAFVGRRGYLNTATCGLPSMATLAGLDGHAAEWREGAGDMALWDEPVARCRELFAQLVAVPATAVSIGSQVAVTAAAVAGSLRPGTRVVLARGDFTSLTWPFLSRRDLDVVQVEVADVPDAARRADWVAASTVQSRDGERLDVDAVAATGVRTVLDATQSAGWLPLDAGRFDVVVVGAYKWLCSPRGVAFTTWSDRALAEITPLAPNWYAGEEVFGSLYSDDVALATDARRHDVSPAWMCWAGAVPVLEMFVTVGPESVGAHNIALANAFCDRMGLPGTDSAIVSVEAHAGDEERLAAAGVAVSSRAGRIRLAFHLYNDDDDVRLAADALSA